MSRTLPTRRGALRFPVFAPVTTFGPRYPLDALVRPYLPRLARLVMVSAHYAGQAQPHELPLAPTLPLMVDSGGFAALFARATLVEADGTGHIQLAAEGDGPDARPADTITPRGVLELQERIADIGCTLDFPIPPGLAERDPAEAARRQRLSIANARWALDNRRRRDLPLYAGVQGWDVASYVACAEAVADLGGGRAPEGVAIGGLVPRAQDRALVAAVVRAVRGVHPDRPLHVFGLGHPELVRLVLDAGADSTDSSAHLKAAADGHLWAAGAAGLATTPLADASPTERLHLALCNLAASRAAAEGGGVPLGAAPLAFTTHTLATALGARA